MSLNHSQIKKEEIIRILKTDRPRIIALGVCGAGMSPLVRLMATFGCEILGVDRIIESPEIKNLAKLGIKVYNEEEINVKSAKALIYSLAIDENNPVFIRAKAIGVPVMSRAEALGALVSLYSGSIAVSGSHGKSTVTAMLRYIFKEAKKSPTVLCGARIDDTDGLDLGSRDLIIYESCEYKDSFLYMPPRVQIITSVELDHTDYFGDLEALRRSFGKAVENAREAVIINVNERYLISLAKNCGKTVITYGKSEEADNNYQLLSSDCNGQSFTVDGVEMYIPVIGEHNVMNALCAYTTAKYLGIAPEIIKKALKSFKGVENRLERVGNFEQLPLFLDYAHHPTEIKAAISAVKELYGACTVIFKPHTYSRTAALWSGFKEALSEADRVILTDVYAARERNTYGIRASDLAKEIGDKCCYLIDEEKIKEALKGAVGAVIIMGAGGMEKIKSILV